MNRNESLLVEAESLMRRLAAEIESRTAREGWIDYRRNRLVHAANRAVRRQSRRTMRYLFRAA